MRYRWQYFNGIENGPDPAHRLWLTGAQQGMLSLTPPGW
jgi:hypothetical protein